MRQKNFGYFAFLVLFAMGVFGCGPDLPADEIFDDGETAVFSNCPITQPPQPPFVPPEPYAAVPPNGEFWYGSNQLWTLLWPDGRWEQLPQTAAGYGNKLVWFREGYVWTEEERPELTISAHQLDGDGVVVPMTEATNGYEEQYGSFMLTGIQIPNSGCWEIRGEYEGNSLRYVVWVAP
ncbi:MAG: hypothetical protein DHS20C20_06500 [Ardenticatenaceae bacterium]|nr:MAG: hypothetical protein DHS20C20_06500 [Ardenticatenaceae bacterium]